MLFLVARLDAIRVRLNPDLQKMHRLGPRGVEFAMLHAGSRAHPLYVTGSNRRAIADGILVCELAGKYIGDDLHVSMAMRSESGAALHSVFVDNAKRTEADVLRI